MNLNEYRESRNIHAEVKTYFQTISLQNLFKVATEHYINESWERQRFPSKHSAAREQRAIAKRLKRAAK